MGVKSLGIPLVSIHCMRALKDKESPGVHTALLGLSIFPRP